MKNSKKALYLATLLISLACCGINAQESQESENQNIITDIASFIGNTISEIVSGTAEIARKVVSEATETNIFETGYGRKRKHIPLPECAPESARTELASMHEEYSAEIRKYEEELGQELLKGEAEFEASVTDGDSRRVVNEKKRALERQADGAYRNFDTKVNALNEVYDTRREEIVKLAASSEECK